MHNGISLEFKMIPPDLQNNPKPNNELVCIFQIDQRGAICNTLWVEQPSTHVLEALEYSLQCMNFFNDTSNQLSMEYGSYQLNFHRELSGKVLVQVHKRLTSSRLREASELYRTAFQHSPVASALIGSEGLFLSVNVKFCQLMGFARHELLHISMDVVTHPEDLHLDTGYRKLMQDGQLHHYQITRRYINRSGDVWTARTHISAVRNPDGALEMMVCQLEDLRLTLDYQQHLENLSAQWHQAQQMARMCTFQVNLKTSEIHFSRGIRHLCGQGVSSMHIANLQSWWTPEGYQQFMDALQVCSMGEPEVQLRIETLLTPDVPWQVLLHPIPGNPQGFEGLMMLGFRQSKSTP